MKFLKEISKVHLEKRGRLMGSLSNLKESIRETFLENTCIVDFLCEGQVDLLTGESTIAIAETTPETVGTVPFLGYSISKNVPLTKDDPTLGYYKSNVILTAVAQTSPAVTYIGDLVCGFLNNRPLGESRKWYRDFSNNCVYCTYSQYLNRYSLRPRRNDDETDVYTELIEFMLIWRDCPCSNIRCDEPPEICPIDQGSNDYDIEDCEC